MLTAAQVFSAPEPHEFVRAGEGRYQFTVPEFSTDFEVNHVRRERHQLYAEITIFCGLAGVSTYNAALFPATVNLSSLRDRDHLARTLASRTRTDGAAWAAIVSELALRVKQGEEIGAGAVNLRDVAPPGPEQFYRVGRLLLPKKHPSIFFGDGDTLKTYIAIHIAFELVRQSVRVGFADWELTDGDHRTRADTVTTDPDLIYIPCSRPLIYEAERIDRLRHEHGLEYIFYDSATPACNGRPEDAENASAFYRVLRGFGIGAGVIAHTNRSEQSDQKPFGSVFWFNLARAIWHVKRAESTVEGVTEIGLYPRKFNLGAVQKATAFRFQFTDTRTIISNVDITEIDTLAAKLPLKDRIAHLVRSKARSIPELAADLDSDAETISRTIRRYSGERAKFQLFTKLPDDRIGLVERRAS